MSYLLAVAILVKCQRYSSIVLILPVFSGWLRGLHRSSPTTAVHYFGLRVREEHLGVYNHDGKDLCANRTKH